MKKISYKTLSITVLAIALLATAVYGAFQGGPRGMVRGLRAGGGPFSGPNIPGLQRPDRPFGPQMGPGVGPVAGPGARMLGGLRQLDLTDEQKEAIQEILKKEDTKSARQEAIKAVEDAHKALREATQTVSEGQAEAGLIEQAASKLAAALTTQAKAQAQTVAEIKKVLTAEQIDKLTELKEKAKRIREKLSDPDVREGLKMMRDFRGRGGRGGFGPGRMMPGMGQRGGRGGFGSAQDVPGIRDRSGRGGFGPNQMMRGFGGRGGRGDFGPAQGQRGIQGRGGRGGFDWAPDQMAPRMGRPGGWDNRGTRDDYDNPRGGRPGRGFGGPTRGMGPVGPGRGFGPWDGPDQNDTPEPIEEDQPST